MCAVQLLRIRLESAQSIQGLFYVHWFYGNLFRTFQLFIETVGSGKCFLIRIDFHKRRKTFDCGQFGEGIFQMDFVFGKIGIYHSVNIGFRSGNAQKLHFLNHIFTSCY